MTLIKLMIRTFLTVISLIVIFSPNIEAIKEKEICCTAKSKDSFTSKGDCRIVNTIYALEHDYELRLYGSKESEIKHIVAVSKDGTIFDFSRQYENTISWNGKNLDDNFFKNEKLVLEFIYDIKSNVFQNKSGKIINVLIKEWYLDFFIWTYRKKIKNLSFFYFLTHLKLKMQFY